MMPMNSTEVCPRCLGTHEGLERQPLARPMDPPEVPWAWEFWATCPTTGDPILTSLSWAFITDGPPPPKEGT